MAAKQSDDDFDQIFCNAVSYTLHSQFPNIEDMKLKQEEALYNYIKRKDVLAVLPTGCGKSLIFQMVPKICAYFHQCGFPYPMNAILIVICPLNALIDSHLKELKKHGIKGCSLNDGMYDITDLTNGKYSIIFTNPESLILNKNWRTMLQSSIYQENLFGIVADEAHVVPKW